MRLLDMTQVSEATVLHHDIHAETVVLASSDLLGIEARVPFANRCA